MVSSRQIVLRERPTTDINPSLDNGTFAEKTVEVGQDVPKGSVIVKVLYTSIDPAMRGWLRDARSYLPPVQIGEVMRSGEWAHSPSYGLAIADDDAFIYIRWGRRDRRESIRKVLPRRSSQWHIRMARVCSGPRSYSY